LEKQKMSRGHARRQIDFSKPLIKVDNVDEFFRQDTVEPIEPVVAPTAHAETKADSGGANPKKANIIIPVVKTVEDSDKSKANGVPNYLDEKMLKKRKAQIQYLRTSYKVFVPSPNEYEVTDRDLNFLKDMNHKIAEKSITASFTPEAFQKIVETWENEVAKEVTTRQTQPTSNTHETIALLYEILPYFTNFIEGALKDYLQDIYNYWKGLREQYKRPLLRKHWKLISKDENNPNTVFRTREQKKMTTRRSQKYNDLETLEKMKTLKANLDIAMAIIGNVTYREMIKLELMELSLMKFDLSTQEKPDTSLQNQLLAKFKEKYEMEPNLAFKSKLKEFNKTAIKYINQNREVVEKVQDPAAAPIIRPHKSLFQKTGVRVSSTSDEEKFDLAAFIASITEESILKDITPHKVSTLDFPVINTDIFPSSVGGASNQMIIEKPADLKEFPIIQRPQMPTPLNDSRKSLELPIKQHERVKTNPPAVEEKNIFKYKIRKRFGRQGRVYLDKIVLDDDALKPLPNDIHSRIIPRISLNLPSDVMEKLPQKELYDIYSRKFSKYQEVYPFADSDDDNDLSEFTKQLKKNLSSSFKNFQKTRRSTSVILPPGI
jgi:hypothetical protein